MSNLYTALFISEPVRRLLLAKFPPVHEIVYADHVTLCFKPDNETVLEAQNRSGCLVNLYVVAHIIDTKGQALWVSSNNLSGLKITQDTIHLTISCAPDVSPVYSNQLFKSVDPVEPLYQFTAFVGVCSTEDKKTLPVEMHKRRGLSR